MSHYLPTGNFRWMTDKEISKIDPGKYKADGKKGLILDLDLEYPQELHNLHNDYPITPEKIKVSNGMLSENCKKLPKIYDLNRSSEQTNPNVKRQRRVCITLSESSAIPRSWFENKESPSSARI